MTTAPANHRINYRRACWFLAATAQVWVACSSSNAADTGPSVDSAAGSEAEAGQGATEAGAAGVGASAGEASAGAAGSGASGGSAGEIGAAGVGGVPALTEGGASGAANGEFLPAPHPPFPLVTAHGGPVIPNIELVPVYFGDDPLRADLERFNTWIVGSDFWKQTGAEYGVHVGTRLAAQQFPSPVSPTTDVAIASWINAQVDAGTLPKPSANTVFALFYQAGTTITTAAGTSCNAFGALHGLTQPENPMGADGSDAFTGRVPFVIVPRCSFSAGDELMIATDVASHEYMESATDPLGTGDPSWTMDNQAGPLEAWAALNGPEVADLCEGQAYDEVDGFAVNDIWSNAAAQAGNNPCQPSDPKHPFFTVSAETTIYHAQPGTTLVIPARAWSNMAAPDWSLGINWGLVPDSDFDGGAVLSKTIVNNGDEVTATVTIPASPPVVNGRSVYRFTIDSIDPINPNFSHPWPFLVVVP